MTKATLNPAKTETKTIILEPESVTLTMTKHQASMLLAILSQANSTPMWHVYVALLGAGIVPITEDRVSETIDMMRWNHDPDAQ